MSADRHYPLLIALLAILTLALFLLSLTTGPAGIAFADSMKALLSDKADGVALIMREIRLPRALLGLMIGATLGLSGAVLQGYLRNPLAEPGLSASFLLALPLAALAGAVAAVLVVQAIAGARGGALLVILAGIAISSFAGAMTSLALNLSPNPFAAVEIMFWMLGSLTDRSMVHVWLATPFMLIGWAMLGSLGRALDALTLGSETAASMGIELRKVQFLAVFGTAAGVGAATAVAGAIGFVGLVVPHILRPLVGARPSRLLPASALGGACMVLTADILVRIVAPERDLKLGVLTAIVGAPFFLWLVFHTRRRLL
jgi:iron complex transport system permease protein